MTAPRTAPDSAWRGFLILIGLVVVAIAVFNLDAMADLTRRDIRIVALVPHAPGVRSGTTVWVEGIHVGKVRAVGLRNQEDSLMVALDLRIEADAAALVTRGSDVRASRRRFIGDPVIRIFAGDPGQPPIRDGDTIRGRARPLFADLLDDLTDLRPTFDSITESTRTVHARVEALRRHDDAGRDGGLPAPLSASDNFVGRIRAVLAQKGPSIQAILAASYVVGGVDNECYVNYAEGPIAIG